MSQPANGVPDMKKNLGEIGRRRSYFCDKQRKSLNGLVATLNLEPGQVALFFTSCQLVILRAYRVTIP